MCSFAYEATTMKNCPLCAEQDTKNYFPKPIGKNVLIRRDGLSKVTKGGIHLPEKTQIKAITGRVVELGDELEAFNCPVGKYDKILYDPSYEVPVDLMGEYLSNEDDKNHLFIIPYENILVVYKKESNDTDN